MPISEAAHSAMISKHRSCAADAQPRVSLAVVHSRGASTEIGLSTAVQVTCNDTL